MGDFWPPEPSRELKFVLRLMIFFQPLTGKKISPQVEHGHNEVNLIILYLCFAGILICMTDD